MTLGTVLGLCAAKSTKDWGEQQNNSTYCNFHDINQHLWHCTCTLTFTDTCSIICWHFLTLVAPADDISWHLWHHLLTFTDTCGIICWHLLTLVASSVDIYWHLWHHLLPSKLGSSTFCCGKSAYTLNPQWFPSCFSFIFFLSKPHHACSQKSINQISDAAHYSSTSSSQVQLLCIVSGQPTVPCSAPCKNCCPRLIMCSHYTTSSAVYNTSTRTSCVII